MATDPRDGGLRSGDFSSDPRFDPEARFEAVANAENEGQVSEAMRAFVQHADPDHFARAVAVYVRSARSRKASVEEVLGVLNRLAVRHEGSRFGAEDERTELRTLMLRGVLLAFYGADAVMRDEQRRARRAADTDPSGSALPSDARR